MCLNQFYFVFQDAVADQIFELLLEYFSIHAHSIAFPEVALPAVVRVSITLKSKLIVSQLKKRVRSIIKGM